MSDSRKSLNALTTADQLVTEFQSLWKATAVNILLIGELVCNVDARNDDAVKAAFYLGVGFERNSSTARKWRVIGKAAAELTPYADRLPHSWTTVYQIARLPGDERKELITSDRLSSSMTAAQLKGAKPTPSADDHSSKRRRVDDKANVSDDHREIRIKLASLSYLNARDFCRAIRNTCETYQCEMSAPDDLRPFLGFSDEKGS